MARTVNISLKWEIADEYGGTTLGVIGDLYKTEPDGYWIDTLHDGSLLWVPADAVAEIRTI